MARHILIAILPLALGCASRGYVEEQLQASEGSLRGDLESMKRTMATRLDDMERTVDANKQSSASTDDLGKARKFSEQTAATADQNAKALAALRGDVEQLRQAVNAREDLQRKVEIATQKLVDATAEFQRHRADVDHALTSMDVKVDEVRKGNSAQEKRLNDFFYLQQKNLRRQKESLQAEVELIDKLLTIMSGVDTEGAANPESQTQSQSGGPGHNGSK